MASKMSERLNFKSVEELLGVVNEEAAMDIEIYKISGFKGHPFKVIDDEKMQELVESIKVNGTSAGKQILSRSTDFRTSDGVKCTSKGAETDTSEVTKSTPLVVPESAPLNNKTNTNNIYQSHTKSNHILSADGD